MPDVYLGGLEPEVDYRLLLQLLLQYRKPKDKIRNLVKEGDLRRISRGQYILGPKYHKPFSKFVLANRLWGPSYVSAESALSYYGAIPEAVRTVTSMTTKRTKVMQTSVGYFDYVHVSAKYYSLGITIKEVRDNAYIFFATPEKSLADLLIQQRSIKSQKQLEAYVLGMRFDEDFIANLNIENLVQIYTVHKSKALGNFIRYWRHLC